MPGAVQAAWPVVSISKTAKLASVVGIIPPILQTKKVGLREVQKPVQGCTARNQTTTSLARHVCFYHCQLAVWPSAGGRFQTTGCLSVTHRESKEHSEASDILSYSPTPAQMRKLRAH